VKRSANGLKAGTSVATSCIWELSTLNPSVVVTAEKIHKMTISDATTLGTRRPATPRLVVFNDLKFNVLKVTYLLAELILSAPESIIPLQIFECSLETNLIISPPRPNQCHPFYLQFIFFIFSLSSASLSSVYLQLAFLSAACLWLVVSRPSLW